MKEFTRTVEKEEIVYEITKQELLKIRNEERVKGRMDIVEYVTFTFDHFYLKLNTGGKLEFMKQLFHFIVNDAPGIENTYRLTFQEYIKKYRSK